MKEKSVQWKIDVQAVAKEIARLTGKALEDIAKEVAKEANKRAPKDPKSRHARGLTAYPARHHKGSIKSKKVKKDGVVVGGLVRSHSGRGYWIEMGTDAASKHHKTKARPHIMPAFESMRDEAESKLTNIV
jgi:hypothetical protein